MGVFHVGMGFIHHMMVIDQGLQPTATCLVALKREAVPWPGLLAESTDLLESHSQHASSVWLYIIYLSIYRSIYLSMYVSMYLCMYVCMHACMHVRTYVCICTHQDTRSIYCVSMALFWASAFGRRWLVPMNYVQKLAASNTAGFYQTRL